MSGYSNINSTYNPTVRWAPEDISGTTGALSWPSMTGVGDGSIGIQKTGSNYASGLIGGKPALNINPSTSIDHTKKIALKLNPTSTYLGSNGITTVCVVQDFWGDPSINSFTRFINWLDSTPNTGEDSDNLTNLAVLVRGSGVGNLETVYGGSSRAHTYINSYGIVGNTPTVIVARYNHNSPGIPATEFKLWINKEFNFVQTTNTIDMGALDIQHIGLGYVNDATGNSLKSLGRLKVSEVMFWNSALTDQQIKNLTQDILIEYGVRTPITHTPSYDAINATYSPSVWWKPDDIGGITPGKVQWYSSVGNGIMHSGTQGANLSISGTIGGKTAIYTNPSTHTDITHRFILDLGTTYAGSGDFTVACVVQNYGDIGSSTRMITLLDDTPTSGANDYLSLTDIFAIGSGGGFFGTQYNSGSFVWSTPTPSTVVDSNPTLVIMRYTHLSTEWKIWFNKTTDTVVTTNTINLGGLTTRTIGFGVGTSAANYGKLRVSEVIWWDSPLTNQQIKNLTQDILIEYGIRTTITHTPVYDAINATYSPSVWWKPEDIGGFNTGGKVQWYSSVGSGSMYASPNQGTASHFSANTIGGKTAVVVDPSSITDSTKYVMLDLGTTYNGSGDFTIAFVVKDFVADGAYARIISLLDATPTTGNDYDNAQNMILVDRDVPPNNGLLYGSGVGGDAYSIDYTEVASTPAVFIARYTSSGTQFKAWLGKTSDQVIASSTTNFNGLTIRTIGFGGYTVNQKGGLKVSEVIFWDSPLTDQQVTDLSQVLLVEYGVRPNITTPVSSGPIIINPITSNVQFKGTWIAGTYNQNDIVYYKNSELFYKCNQTTTTEEPTIGSHWDFIPQNVIRTNSNQLIGAARTNIFSGTNLLVNTVFNSATVTGYIPPVTVVPAAVTLPFTVEEISAGTNYKLVLGSYGTSVPTQQNYTATVTFDSTGGNFTQDVQFTVDNRPEFVGLMVTTKNLGFVNKNNAFTSSSPVIILGTELELNGETITSIDFELHNGTGLVSTPSGMQINISTLNLEIPSMAALAEDTYYIKKIVVTDEENETAILSPEIYVQFTYADLPTSAPTLAGNQVQYWNSYTITDGSSTFASLNVLDFDTSYVLTRVNENNYIVENITVDYVNKMNISSGFGILDIDTYNTNYTLDSLVNSSYIFEDVDGLEMQNVNTGSYIIKFTVKFSAFEGATNLGVDTWNVDFYATFSVKSQSSSGTHTIGYGGVQTTTTNEVNINISNLFSQGFSSYEIKQKIIDLVITSDSYTGLSQAQKDRILPVISKISAIFSESNGIAFRSISSSSNTSTGININLIR